MKRALLLNTDCTPLNFVSGARALNLLFKGRVELISLGPRPSVWDDKFTTPTRSYDIPATIRMLENVNRRHTSPRFRKHALFNRDNWQCQYCGADLVTGNRTIDHVVPRCRGGSTTWKNCVASCKRCNTKKGSRTPHDAGMRLRRHPIEPRLMHFWEVRGHMSWHPDWHAFFSPHDTYRS